MVSSLIQKYPILRQRTAVTDFIVIFVSRKISRLTSDILGLLYVLMDARHCVVVITFTSSLANVWFVLEAIGFRQTFSHRVEMKLWGISTNGDMRWKTGSS